MALSFCSKLSARINCTATGGILRGCTGQYRDPSCCLDVNQPKADSVNCAVCLLEWRSFPGGDDKALRVFYRVISLLTQICRLCPSTLTSNSLTRARPKYHNNGMTTRQAHTHRCVGRRSLALPNTPARKRGGAQLPPPET